LPAANGVVAHRSCVVTIAGEEVVLLADRGLFWPARSTLIVADLHWGKAETFHAAGIPIPGGILAYDLARLSRMLASTGASRLLVLGDLAHSGVGLAGSMIDTVSAWRALHSVRIDLVPGNHDRHVDRWPASWGIEVLDPEVREGPLGFRHDPEGPGAPAAEYTLCGHIHPMARLEDLRVPCFALGPVSGLLPAFSAFTRGRTIQPEAGMRLFLTFETEVVPLVGLRPNRRITNVG
jgi:DNA ligase-associated metallophosphoesterase